MKKTNANIITVLFFAALVTGSANGSFIPIKFEQNSDFMAAAKTSPESQKILDEISEQEKNKIQNNTSILNEIMNEAAKQNNNYPVVKYGLPSNKLKIKEEITPILKYAPPAMSLYAVPDRFHGIKLKE